MLIPAPVWRPCRAAPVPPNTASPCRGLRLSPALPARLSSSSYAQCASALWRHSGRRPRSRVRPCSRAPPLSVTVEYAPGPRGSAPVEPTTVPDAGHWVLARALPWASSRRTARHKQLRRSGFPAFWSGRKGPVGVFTGFARFSQRALPTVVVCGWFWPFKTNKNPII